MNSNLSGWVRAVCRTCRGGVLLALGSKLLTLKDSGRTDDGLKVSFQILSLLSTGYLKLVNTHIIRPFVHV